MSRDVSMKVVYTLRSEIERDSEQVRIIRELSLNDARPEMGLSPRHGLYGSDEWWDNVSSGVIQSATYQGVITELYAGGWTSDRRPDTFVMELDGGGTYTDGMASNDPSLRTLYAVGRRIDVTTILVELKRRSPSGALEYVESPLVIAIQRRAPKPG